VKEEKQIEVLNKLSAAVTGSDRKREKLHQVFESSFDAKELRTKKFIEQKLSYMHRNPCSGVWNLAASPTDYVHSSAAFYARGIQGVYKVTNYMGLEDVNLTVK
jgi:hypothetical protein